MATLTKVSVNGQVYDLGGSGGETIIETTYAELKSLKDSSALVPNQKYRITDYVTMTNPEKNNYKSAEHPFDIVVSAISTSVLDRKASAMRRDVDDGYFADSRLEDWSLLYTIDNDTERYSFCDPNGKGVIYEMIDEHQNFACFDFKNILSRVSSISNVNVKSELYFYLISYINENTQGEISKQENIFDATVRFKDISKNKFFAFPSNDHCVVLTKSSLDDLLKMHIAIKNCEFKEKVFFISVSSINNLLLMKSFTSYFNITNIEYIKGFFTGNYPLNIGKVSGYIPDPGVTKISMCDCEFNMVHTNNPILSMGVPTIENVKMTMLDGNGGGATILSTKFNNSIVYFSCEESVDAFLVDDLVPSELTNFSGCEVHLYARENLVNSTLYSITTGYAIDRNGTVHKLIEFDSSTLDKE